MKTTNITKTTRSEISLRKLEPEDLPWLYQWENDASCWGVGGTHNPLSRSDLRSYIASTTGDIYRDGQLRLMIVQDGVSVGVADLFDLDIRNRKAAMGLYISSEFRGHGIGVEVVRQLVDYCRSQLSLRMVYAVIGVDNLGCSHIFERCHFTPSACLTQWTLEGDALVWQMKLEESS